MAFTESSLKAKFKASDRDWDQWCQAGVVNASIWSGGFKQTYASANDAYHASRIVSKDPKKAPINAVHYWDIGKFGHVAGGLGGSRVFMCSKFVDVFWGTNVGTTTVERYSAKTGAKYLGWARTNGVNSLKLAVTPPKGDSTDEKHVKAIAKYLNGRRLGYTTTAVNDGKRGKIYWTLIQLAGKKDKLYGDGYIVDGDPGGTNSKTRALEKHYLAKIS